MEDIIVFNRIEWRDRILKPTPHLIRIRLLDDNEVDFGEFGGIRRKVDLVDEW